MEKKKMVKILKVAELWIDYEEIDRDEIISAQQYVDFGAKRCEDLVVGETVEMEVMTGAKPRPKKLLKEVLD
ncbi:MAG: hypothetical protein ACRC4M_04580 [Mycoplasma sp.]